jgi:hypothetical protein
MLSSGMVVWNGSFAGWNFKPMNHFLIEPMNHFLVEPMNQ